VSDALGPPPDAGAPDALESLAADAAPPSPAVAALHEALEREPWRFHFYHAMRRLEAAHADAPRFGRAQRLREDPVRFGQEPTLAFVPATLASFRRADARHAARLETFFIGLFGPNGPLPLHLTEHARERSRNTGDETFRRFADIFHHRMVQLFYRAWADAQPTAQFDRPHDDRFALHLGALCGYGTEHVRGRDALPDHARLHWAGLLALPTRPAEGLANLLSGFFRMPVTLIENAGHWIHLPEGMKSRLGADQCALGTSATLGERVWDAAGKFRIVFGPVGYPDFVRMLPGSPSLARLVAIVRSWVGDEMWWDVNVVLRKDEVPGTRLGRAGQLGWTSWLQSVPARRDAADYVLDPVGLAG
jgi:type VI secretion system protein ImpH